MSSVVISGDTSGAVTISAPAVAGTTTLTLPATSGTILQSGTTVTEAQGGTGTTTGYYGFKNRIINGAMVIDQRNAGASVTPNNTYVLDRWIYQNSQTSKFTVQQNQNSVTPPAGFTYYSGLTSSSAYTLLAGDYFVYRQMIEGFNVADLAWGTASAATVTLSFWVRSSLTGTFGGALLNGASNRSYPFTYTISTANTWELETITIAGDTTGTWLTTNGIGLHVGFSLGTGSTYSGTAGAWSGSLNLTATGATSVVGTNGATFFITGVQLEKGSTATSFDYRPYGTELALCQRYYYRTTYGANSTTLAVGAVNTTTSAAQCGFTHPVTMRASPTAAFSGVTVYDGSTNPAVTSISAQSSSTTHASINVNATSGGLTVGRPACILAANSTQYLDFLIEL